MSAASDDDEPFALGSALGAELAGLAGGEHARLGMEADRKRRFKLKVEGWASKRGLAVVDGAIVATMDDAKVTLALYEMTEETAVVRATAPAAARLSISAEPVTQSWTSGLLGRFKKRSAPTGDAAFDALFYVRTSDDAALQQVFSDDVRAGLLAMDAWCSVTYADGRIELRLDSPRLAGAHVRRAIEVVGAMARARVQTNAYR